MLGSNPSIGGTSDPIRGFCVTLPDVEEDASSVRGRFLDGEGSLCRAASSGGVFTVAVTVTGGGFCWNGDFCGSSSLFNIDERSIGRETSDDGEHKLIGAN